MLALYEDMYAGIISHVLQTGEMRPTRNGNAVSVFAKSFQLKADRIPVISARKYHYRGVLGELAAFLRGPKSAKDFQDMGCNYWNKWADDNGDINVDYGNAWTDFNGFDQLAALKQGLKEDPYGRRHIISGWRPDKLAELSLPCCHMLYQWYVTKDGTLKMIWYQRSVDLMLGLPSNMILGSTWNQLLANELGLKSGTVTFMLGDVHIYEKHLEGSKKYLISAANLAKYTHYYKPSAVYLDIAPGMKTEDFLPNMHQEHHYDPAKGIDMELLK